MVLYFLHFDYNFDYDFGFDFLFIFGILRILFFLLYYFSLILRANVVSALIKFNKIIKYFIK